MWQNNSSAAVCRGQAARKVLRAISPFADENKSSREIDFLRPLGHRMLGIPGDFDRVFRGEVTAISFLKHRVKRDTFFFLRTRLFHARTGTKLETVETAGGRQFSEASPGTCQAMELMRLDARVITAEQKPCTRVIRA